MLPKGADTRVNRFAELRRGPFEACTAGETADDDARGTNWPGSVLGKIITATVYRHNFGGRFITIRARMFNGVEYVGRASYDNGNCINLRKAVKRGR